MTKPLDLNIPDEMHAKLKKRAKEKGMGMHDTVMDILRRSLANRRVRPTTACLHSRCQPGDTRCEDCGSQL